MSVRGGGHGTIGGCLIVTFIALWSTSALSSAGPLTSRHLSVPLDSSSSGFLTSVTGLQCDSCHGVPPATGAHAAHADWDSYDFGFDCNSCHFETFPQLHDDGTVDVRLSPTLPTIGNIGVTYGNGTCSDSYCHSDGRGKARAVSWNDGTVLGCDGCHDYRTSLEIDMSGNHQFHLNSGVECAACHAEIVNVADLVTEFPRHVDGTVDVAVLAGDYDAGTASCQNGCHETRVWASGGRP